MSGKDRNSDEKRPSGDTKSLEQNEPGTSTDENNPPRSLTNNATEMAPVPDAAAQIGGWMIALLWIIALGMGVYAAQNWLDKRAQKRDGVWMSDASGSHSLRLTSNRYGQYRVKGSANDQPIHFLIDTGASGISIPAAAANTLGLRRGRAFEVSTANGTTTVYATKLDSISIGPLTRRDVTAHINPSMDGDMALLGMSFLRHYELVQRAGELTISPP